MSLAKVRLGKRGEELAEGYLKSAGCGILASNYRCPWGEIDLVAQDGEELAFVEVRTRRGSTFGTPRESITPKKARNLVAAAQDYLQNHVPEKDQSDQAWRIDLVSVQMTKGQASPKSTISSTPFQANRKLAGNGPRSGGKVSSRPRLTFPRQGGKTYGSTLQSS